METTISCGINTTDAALPLGLEIWIDDLKIFDRDHVDHAEDFSYNITDNDGSHQLRFILKNKQPEHTQVDETGNIVKDARLIIDRVAFDGIELGLLLTDNAVYRHDYNGSGKQVEDKFFGEMGCNGTVSLEFTTPIYLWLLEHM